MKLTEKEDGIHKLLENPVTNERPGILVSEVTDGSRKKTLTKSHNVQFQMEMTQFSEEEVTKHLMGMFVK